MSVRMASYQRQSAMTPPLTSPAAAASHQPRTKASLGLRERLDLRDLDRESEDDYGARLHAGAGGERTSRGSKSRAVQRQKSVWYLRALADDQSLQETGACASDVTITLYTMYNVVF